MFNPSFAVYLGKEIDKGFSGFITEGNLFLSLEIEEGFSSDEGRGMLQKLKTDILEFNINNLDEFEQFLNDSFKKFNFPSSFSLAAGYLKDDIFYLKTVGKGKIFLRRGQDFELIIEKENSASGYLTDNDFFILTTEKFVELFGGELELRSIFDSKNPHQIVDELTPLLKSKEDIGVVALFVQFLKQQTEQSYSTTIPPKEKVNHFFSSAKNIYPRLISYPKKIGRKKTLTLAIVCIISLILIWSISLGFQRMNNSDSESKVKNVKELVSLKLKQADDVVFLNLPRALVLISEAKDEVNKLKKQVGKQKSNEIATIEKSISDEENKITKKEEKKYEEFYDLTLDNKDAKGDKLYLDGDSLNILDKSRGIIYTLSLSKKSLDKKNSSEAKSANLIGSYQDSVLFFVKGQGIYRISSDNKVKKVIEQDKDWGNIVALSIYNENIYLLDSAKDQIYKYVPTDNGFSDKNLYFKSGSGISFKNSNSLAIDSSIYLGFNDHILKYTAGIPDDFKTAFSEKGINIKKIFTSKDVEKVYGWDKPKSVIYVINKDGTYEREINSSIISKADDFVVSDTSAYVLVKEKIYKISLN